MYDVYVCMRWHLCVCAHVYVCEMALLCMTKSRLAIRVLNYCRARVNVKRLNDVTLMKARGCIACTLSGC